jgi:hypothetical protein
MNLHCKFIDIAKKYKKRTAIIDNATGQTYTYGKLLIASLLLSSFVKKIMTNLLVLCSQKQQGDLLRH